jgi:hypothetical protein
MVNPIKEIKTVYWVSSSRTSVHAIVVYEEGQVERVVVTKDENNPFWQKIMERMTEDDIENNTKELHQSKKQQAKVEAYRQQEKHIQRKYNELFNAKIEAFDLPEVVNASAENRSLIRKSKNLTELYARVAACIISSSK